MNKKDINLITEAYDEVKDQRIEQALKKLIIAYRAFTENTGRTTIFDMLSKQFKDKEKIALILALGDLEEAYCEKNGWASTNPMVVRNNKK